MPKKSATITMMDTTHEVRLRQQTIKVSPSDDKATPSTSTSPSKNRKTNKSGATHESGTKRKRSVEYVIGVDEAGRGPLCGPVTVAAACVAVNPAGLEDGDDALPAKKKKDDEAALSPLHQLLNDSKKMPESARDAVYKWFSTKVDEERAKKAESFAAMASVTKGPPTTDALEEKEKKDATDAEAEARKSDTFVGYSVEFVTAKEIDERNILNASLEGMHRAVDAVVKKVNDEIGQQEKDKGDGDDSIRPLITAENTLLLFDGPYLPHQLRNPEEEAKKKKKKQPKKKARKSKKKGDDEDGDDDKKNEEEVEEPLPIPTSPYYPYASQAVVKGDSRCPTIALASVFCKVSRDLHMHVLGDKFPQYGLKDHKGYPTAYHMSTLRTHGPCEEHRRSYGPVKEAVEVFEKKTAKKTEKKATSDSKKKRADEDSNSNDDEDADASKKKKATKKAAASTKKKDSKKKTTS